MKSIVVLFALFAVCHGVAPIAPYQKQNFCQKDKCLTCIGKYCTTTCRGEECNECPNGDCCDGVKCNICRGSKCCKTPDCNTCILTCLKTCETLDTCHHDCFQTCLPSKNETTEQTGAHRFFNNKNYYPVNVTTIINITNTVKNENFIHNPVVINSTTINNATSITTNKKDENIQKNILINYQLPEELSNSSLSVDSPCCEMVHPRICHNVTGYNNFLCFVGKHTECSKQCVGEHVHIVETEDFNNECVLISAHPYYFCGKYEAQDCDACYQCDNSTVVACSKKSSCPAACRTTILPDDLYNTLYGSNK